MRILAVDPGDPSGWALWESGPAGWALCSFGELDDPDAPTVTALLGALLVDCRGCRLVVEAQWYRDPEPRVRAIRRARGRGKSARLWRSPSGRVFEVELEAKRGGAPWDAVAKVVASRVRWESACDLAGMDLGEPVAPGRWIPAMTKGHPERETHKRVRGVVMGRWGERFSRLGYDEAAAILLGEYWIEEQRGRVDRSTGPRRGLRGLPEPRYAARHGDDDDQTTDARGVQAGCAGGELADGDAVAPGGAPGARAAGEGRHG